MKNKIKSIYLLVLVLSVFSFQCQGQSEIIGKIVDENKNMVEFANFLIYENNKLFTGAMSDDKGIFKLQINRKYEKLKMLVNYRVGNGLYCETDTFILTPEKCSDTLLIRVNTQNCDKKEVKIIKGIADIRKEFYYVDFSDFTNDEMKIIKGEDILKKEHSPYDYRIIFPDKKYIDDNGKIYTGQELIKIGKISLDNWKCNYFKPVKEE